MPAGMTTATATDYLADSLGTSTRPASVAPMKLSVETVAGNAGAAGTELPSTTRPTITFGNAPSGTPPVSGNSVACTVVAGGSGTVVAVAVYDSTPTRKWFGPTSAGRAVVVGDSLLFGVNSVTASVTSP